MLGHQHHPANGAGDKPWPVAHHQADRGAYAIRAEVINRGGKKFFPREIEEILYTHPHVLYAAIVGIPDARLGERNCLCLVPRPGEAPTLEGLVAFLGDSVATYKLPERLELFTQFPFTPTGKIQRHALVREVVARMSAAT